MSNMVVRTNVMALNSHRSLKTVGASQSKSSARLSSGYRVNSAADDAAGLAISEKMRAQIRGLDQASTNAQDAISLVQTAEGGMQEIDNMLQRIRELVNKAANDTLDGATDADRQKVADEVEQLITEINSMADRVEFNKKTLLAGSFDSTVTATGTLHFQIGANSSQSLTMYVDSMKVSDISTKMGTAGANFDLSDVISTVASGAATAISAFLDEMDFALDVVIKSRSKLGAAQNRL